ncbi:MAG TPA: hypothetical protein VN931_00995 [Fibrobacteria bacterium]|nr:hypothetical protein [Fibrobacteria bacterium]
MNTVARACALASLFGGTVSALPSDALLDSLQLVAMDHEKAGRPDARDSAEDLLEVLAHQRIAADSAPALPQRRLEELEQLRSERVQRAADSTREVRKPPAAVERMLADSASATTDSGAPGLPAPTPAPAPFESRPIPPLPTPAATVCRPIRFHWIEPSSTSRGGAGILDVKIRLDAPCGLSRIELYADDLPPRAFPAPRTGGGTFEFSDHIPVVEGIHHLEVLACDTTSVCVRSVPLEARLAGRVPPWIPRAVGGLVAVCGLLGLSLLLRRRPHRHYSVASPAYSRPSAVPVPETTGLSGTLRKRLQQVAQEIGPAFPAVSLRLPDQPPSLSVDPESLGDAFSTMLRLHARRSAEGGQILIAMGTGPVSVEIVFEDTASSPDEGSVQAILDLARPRVRERMGLDRELANALASFQRVGGTLCSEIRIDGGLRTRMKVPLAPAGQVG